MMILTVSSSSSSNLQCCYNSNNKTSFRNLNQTQTTTFLFQKTVLLPPGLKTLTLSTRTTNTKTKVTNFGYVYVAASLLQNPVFWVGRLCIFYALLKAGLAGSPSNPLVSDLEGEGETADMGFSKWLGSTDTDPEKEDKEASDKKKLASKWHPTNKGTLRRNYRVPSKSEGRRLLKAVASLLSDDDHFLDASSHKGCQIRRENAHGESVCCNNVRALFDELPTPHLIVEITPFPAGPLTGKDYDKAGKLERLLRSEPSV